MVSFKALFPFLAYTAAASATAVIPRQVVTDEQGIIVAPTAGTALTPGTTFPFQFQTRNWCELDISPITIWITDYPPTTSNVNSTGGGLNEFSYYFGQYNETNFDLPPSSDAPPSSFIMPDLAGSGVSSGSIWLAVIETATTCFPGTPGIPPKYALNVVKVEYV